MKNKLKNHLKNITAKKREGFSIQEIAIGVIIIIMLSLGTFMIYYPIQDSAKIALMKSDLENIATAATSYTVLNVNGTPPSSLDELATGLTADQSVDGKAKNFLQTNRGCGESTTEGTNMVDPWNNPYVVDPTTRTVTSIADDNGDHEATSKHF